MIAFDTNVLTEILLGNAAFVARAAAIPVPQQAVPVIVIEEIIKILARKVRMGKLTPNTLSAMEYKSGFENAAAALKEDFYPMMCPGLLEGYRDNPEALIELYQNLEPVLAPTAYLYRGTGGAQILEQILNDLEVEDSKPSRDFLTLPLPFEDFENKGGSQS